MKKTALTLILPFIFCALSFAQEKSADSSEIKISMNDLLKEIEKDMVTLLEAKEQNNLAIYHLNKTRIRLREKLDSLSLLEKPDILSQIIELEAERSRLLRASSPSNPIVQNLDTQIAKLKKQM